MASGIVFDKVDSEAKRLGITDGPYGRIQWKGTDICADIYCPCGNQSHIDGSFAYVIRCKACGQHWALQSHMQLVPVTKQEMKNWSGSVMETQHNDCDEED